MLRQRPDLQGMGVERWIGSGAALESRAWYEYDEGSETTGCPRFRVPGLYAWQETRSLPVWEGNSPSHDAAVRVTLLPRRGRARSIRKSMRHRDHHPITGRPPLLTILSQGVNIPL
jgi:hypothetical protein